MTEARRWLAEEKLKDGRCEPFAASANLTVDNWYEYWMHNIKERTVRPNTVKNYRDRYQRNIRKHLGRMFINEVKPIHCQTVLNDMVDDYAGSTINQCMITLHNMFQAAEDNDIIHRNPVKKAVKLPKQIEKKTRFLTIEEEKLFLQKAESSTNYPQYFFILQTGVRTGEMVGLKWEDLDFENGFIHISRTMEYRPADDEWRVGPTKTNSGCRDIPMTQACRNLLLRLKMEKDLGRYVEPEFKDFVFINRKGTPTKNSTYDAHLAKIADAAGMKRFSMHALRHTFATRCVEAGMRPKTLQILLGHSNIATTMNLYVHLSDDERKKEIEKFERYELKVN